MNTHKALFGSGIFLLVTGAIITTFFPFFNYFYSLPLIAFFIGLLLIWFSSKKIKTKLLWTFIPVLIFFLYQYSWLQYDKCEPETFLIPSGFNGKVHVVYNKSCGQKAEYENGRRLYKIPNTGILLTQFKDEYGSIDQQYFIIDSNSHRTILPQLDVREYNEEWSTIKNPNEPSRQLLGAFHTGRTGNGNYEDGKTYYFQEFWVCTYQQFNSTFDAKYESAFDSTEAKLISDCGQNK